MTNKKSFQGSDPDLQLHSALADWQLQPPAGALRELFHVLQGV